MDAMQIYQGMRIGTARAEAEALRAVRHHMIACVPPDEKYSVAAYAQTVLPLLGDLYAKGTQPVLVGGTGLYLDAVLYPMRFADTIEDPALRASLDAQTAEALHARLQTLDPRTAQRLPVGDKRRVIRALEIALATGKPMSEVQDSRQARFDPLLLGLTMPRPQLHERIHARVEIMFRQGLEQEVSGLLQGGLSPQAQSMQAIGYKETARFLQGECTRAEAIEAIALGTRRYAKRQETWFRRYPFIQWFDVSAYSSKAALYAVLHGAVTRRQEQRREASSFES